MRNKDKSEFLKFLDVVEIFTMKDILDVFEIDHKTFLKYLGESKQFGKRRGVNENGRRYYSINDVSKIMNMNRKGVKVLMMEYYKRKNDTSPTHQLWLDAKNRINNQ